MAADTEVNRESGCDIYKLTGMTTRSACTAVYVDGWDWESIIGVDAAVGVDGVDGRGDGW